MCLVTSDRELIRKIVGSGLIIWLNGEGGKRKSFGIKFPLGMISNGMPAGEFMRTLRNPESQLDDDQMSLFVEQRFRELQLLADKGKEKNVYALKQAKAKGLEVKLSLKNGLLIYEAKAPLIFDDGIASINIAAENPVGLGLETPTIDSRAMQENMGANGSMSGDRGGDIGGDRSGGMAGGRGGMGGGKGGRGGGMGGRSGMSAPTPVKIWTTISLADAE